MPVTKKFRAAQKAARAVVKRSYPRLAIARSLPSAQVERAVMNIVRRKSDHKYVDYFCTVDGSQSGPTSARTFFPSANLGNNETMAVINVMQQGTSVFNRIGRKTKVMSMRLKLNFDYVYSNNLTAYTTGVLRNQIRAVLIYDKENSGVIPTFSQIFGNTNQLGVTTTTLNSPVQTQHSERYIVIMDRLINLNPDITPPLGDYDIGTGVSSAFYTAVKRVSIDQFIDCSKRNYDQFYQSNSNPATVADLSSGAIYLVLKSLDYITDVNMVTCADSYIRVKLSDI